MKYELDREKLYFAMVAFERNNKDIIRTGRDVDFAKDGPSKGIVAGICSGYVDFPGTEGERGSILVAISLSGGNDNRDDASQAQLRDYGFKIHNAAPARNLVQTCCEPDNVLNQPNPANSDVKMINITKEDDFTSAKGIAKAKLGIRGPRDVLWNSSPCTGGSAIQQLNIAQWGDRALKKIAEHYKLFRKLWVALRGLLNTLFLWGRQSWSSGHVTVATGTIIVSEGF